MNNEPVAWMIDTLDGKHLMLYGSNPPPVFDSEVNAIPLYPHPVKELTDEALITFYEDRLEAGRKREETLMKTVEALLKKAQEK